MKTFKYMVQFSLDGRSFDSPDYHGRAFFDLALTVEDDTEKIVNGTMKRECIKQIRNSYKKSFEQIRPIEVQDIVIDHITLLAFF